MIDDAAAEVAKKQLDADLTNVPPQVGIVFEIDLFDAFVDRKWITSREMKIAGVFGNPEKLPAYGTHPAIRAWDVAPPGYKVGKAD
jgi:hypothetical protein